MKKIKYIIITLILVGCSTTRPLNIQTNSSDILYLGVDNPIVLKGKNIAKAIISIDNGTIKEVVGLSNDTIKTCVVKVDNNNPTFITINYAGKTTTLKYRNKNIPNPEIVISSDSGRIKNGTINHINFRTVHGLGLNIPGFDYDISMKIISYKLTTIKKGTNPTTYSIKGNIVKDYSRFADSSDIFIFHNVLMEFAETKEQRTLNGPTIFVK